MQRPRLHIELDRFDRIFEIIGKVFLVLMIIFPRYYFFQIPDIIPTHFNANCVPDRYSTKIIIFIMPISSRTTSTIL